VGGLITGPTVRFRFWRAEMPLTVMPGDARNAPDGAFPAPRSGFQTAACTRVMNPQLRAYGYLILS
jgi:hypothetical protein